MHAISQLDLSRIADEAALCDRDNRFPEASVSHLRELGLLKAASRLERDSVPLVELAEIASSLGRACLSTALIWSMHCQQVWYLSKHLHSGALGSILQDGGLIASVTTDPGNGGSLFRATQRIESLPGKCISVKRVAPIVSYGAHAQGFAILMQRPDGRNDSDVCFAFALRKEGNAVCTGPWTGMGVRGTQSCPMVLDFVLPEERIISGDHRGAVLADYAPIGQLLWSASWHGALQGAMDALLHARLESNSLASFSRSQENVKRIAECRIALYSVGAQIAECCRCLEAAAGAEPERLLQANQAVNVLKVHASESLSRAALGLQRAAGMREGYCASPPAIERVVRDMLSAPLMYGNDMLVTAIGLTEIEKVRRVDRWQPTQLVRRASA